jgi:hypothetical protein
MQGESGQKQGVIDEIMPAKAFAPEKKRINGAQTVNDHGQQKVMAIRQPGHGPKLNPRRLAARRNCGAVCFYADAP